MMTYARSLMGTIMFVLSLQCLSGCGGPANHKKILPQDADGEPSHKVVQMDWQAQLKDVQKDLAKDPKSPFLHNQAAVAYDMLGDFDSFDREIHIAMRLDPQDPINYYVAYAVYKRRGLVAAQASILEKALELDPNNPFGSYETASMFEHKRDWRKALSQYETTNHVLESVKSDPHNLKNNAWIYSDGRGNPYDVTWQMIHIDDDIQRVHREASQSTKW